MIELIVTPSLYCFVHADDLDTDPVTDEEEEGEEEERDDDDDDMYVTCEECGGVEGSPMSFDDGRGFICVFVGSLLRCRMHPSLCLSMRQPWA